MNDNDQNRAPSREHETKPGTQAHTVTAACRTCGKTVGSDTESFPFCSERCRGADLGKWFDEEYKISREIKDADIDTVD